MSEAGIDTSVSVTIRCPSCHTPMRTEMHHGVTIDHCPVCDDLWFDATELDSDLKALASLPKHPAWEASIPIQGFSARSCPRCHHELESAGWGVLALERCPQCHGFLFDSGELLATEQADTVALDFSFEQKLLSFCNTVGWALLGGKEPFILLGKIFDSIHRK